jgi:hypothetical protein
MTENLPVPAPQSPGEFLLYRTEDGRTRLEVRLTGETVWLALNQMADLFQRDKSVISRHVSNLFEEGELRREGVVAVFATTAADGKTYQVEYYKPYENWMSQIVTSTRRSRKMADRRRCPHDLKQAMCSNLEGLGYGG